MIFDLQKGYKKIISKQKSEIIDLVKSLTKWVIKKELEDDGDYLKRLLDQLISITKTKFIIITHHALTMSKMNRLYGVTMPEKGISQLVSVDLQKAETLVA